MAAGLRPDPLGELKRSPRPPSRSRNKGALLLRVGEGRGRGGEGSGREGKGEEGGGEREGDGRGGDGTGGNGKGGEGKGGVRKGRGLVQF